MLDTSKIAKHGKTMWKKEFDTHSNKFIKNLFEKQSDLNPKIENLSGSAISSFSSYKDDT